MAPYTAIIAQKEGHIQIDSFLISIALLRLFFLNPKVSIVFLFLHGNICCGYSFEAPPLGT